MKLGKREEVLNYKDLCKGKEIPDPLIKGENIQLVEPNSITLLVEEGEEEKNPMIRGVQTWLVDVISIDVDGSRNLFRSHRQLTFDIREKRLTKSSKDRKPITKILHELNTLVYEKEEVRKRKRDYLIFKEYQRGLQESKDKGDKILKSRTDNFLKVKINGRYISIY